MDTSFLPPRASMNTFFVRHVAKPKRMVHIEGEINKINCCYLISKILYSGLNRAPICAVNDDGYFPLQTPPHKSAFPPNNFNEAIINSNLTVDFSKIPKKREKILPPGGRFQVYGISMLVYFFCKIILFRSYCCYYK